MHIEVVYTNERAESVYGETGPKYATPGSCAIDLRAIIDTPIALRENEQAMIQTGIKLHPVFTDIDREFMNFKLAALAMPRSGLGSKSGLVLGNTIGLIDEDYQGEVMLCAWRRPSQFHGETIVINPGDRIAQLMFVPIFQVDFKVVPQHSSTTERGEGGFGSTGQ